MASSSSALWHTLFLLCHVWYVRRERKIRSRERWSHFTQTLPPSLNSRCPFPLSIRQVGDSSSCQAAGQEVSANSLYHLAICLYRGARYTGWENIDQNSKNDEFFRLSANFGEIVVGMPVPACQTREIWCRNTLWRNDLRLYLARPATWLVGRATTLSPKLAEGRFFFRGRQTTPLSNNRVPRHKSPGILNYYTLSLQEKQAQKPATCPDSPKKSVGGWVRSPRMHLEGGCATESCRVQPRAAVPQSHRSAPANAPTTCSSPRTTRAVRWKSILSAVSSGSW